MMALLLSAIIIILTPLCLGRVLPSETSIFSTTSYPKDRRLMATIGNGYIGLAALSDTMYVSGVFNGPAAINETSNNIVSHRARIPSTNSFGFELPTPFSSLFVLDVNDALYREQYTFPQTATRINHTIFAHQTHRNLLITTIDVDNTRNANPFQFGYYNQAGKASQDINFTSINCPQSPFTNLTCVAGWTQIAEYSAAQINVVLVHFNLQQNTIHTPASTKQKLYFPTIILTTLDPNTSSLTILADAVKLFEELYQARSDWLSLHVNAWENLWGEGRIDVIGNATVAASVYSSLYYILNSLRSDWPFGLSPGSLSSNAYNGHTFWDQETWMFPPLLMLQQMLARSCLKYRSNRFHGAQVNANLSSQLENIQGSARYPWESGFVGVELCPLAYDEGAHEIHINADIALAVAQYFYMSQDVAFIRDNYAMLAGICSFWADWSWQNPMTQSYEWLNVQGPDEYYVPVNNSVYTNYGAMQSLAFCIEMSKLLNKSYPKTWDDIVANVYLPFDESGQYHPESDNYSKGDKVKQADVILLYFPFNINVSSDVQANDLLYYASVSSASGPAMTWAMFVINWIALGQYEVAQSNFAKSYANIQRPFNVWTETSDGGGSVNFITGAGGFLQQFIFGYPQMRIEQDCLSLNFSYLPWPKMALIGIDYRANSMDFEFVQADLSFSVVVTQRDEVELSLLDAKGHKHALNVNESVNITAEMNPVRIIQT